MLGPYIFTVISHYKYIKIVRGATFVQIFIRDKVLLLDGTPTMSVMNTARKPIASPPVHLI